MIPTEIVAADYDTPHEFSAGDTISADMINEILDNIKNSRKLFTSSDVIGTWSCVSVIKGDRSDYVTGWQTGPDNLYYYLTGTITFADDGDGTFSFSTSSPNPLHSDKTPASSGESFSIFQGMIWMDTSTIGFYSRPFDFKKFSPTKIRISETVGNTSGPQPISIICDKQNLPPSTPATLTASVSGKTVSLTWTDSSTDETGFKVLRKDSLTGSYSTVTTTSADATSYSDTVTAAGSYWYRVSATNSNGDSVASKMVKVDVE